MATQIQLRRDTAANWESVNPILAQGELGLELVTGLFKIGNGIDEWNDLPYCASGSSIDGGTPESTYLISQLIDGGTQ